MDFEVTLYLNHFLAKTTGKLSHLLDKKQGSFNFIYRLATYITAPKYRMAMK